MTSPIAFFARSLTRALHSELAVVAFFQTLTDTREGADSNPWHVYRVAIKGNDIARVYHDSLTGQWAMQADKTHVTGSVEDIASAIRALPSFRLNKHERVLAGLVSDSTHKSMRVNTVGSVSHVKPVGSVWITREEANEISDRADSWLAVRETKTRTRVEVYA